MSIGTERQAGWRRGAGAGAGALAAIMALGLPAGAALAMSQDMPVMVSANLYGEDVPGGGAGEEASGDFIGEIDLDGGQVCYYLEIAGLDEVTAAHIHEGQAGRTGPPVVTLTVEGADMDEVCLDVDSALLGQIARRPERFYVNVHSARHPDGAIRGQLTD
ncbi:MAG: CHRD domain-containing protein [Alteripontixanthobacter sp.]